jgi:hypothetical protein
MRARLGIVAVLIGSAAIPTAVGTPPALAAGSCSSGSTTPTLLIVAQKQLGPANSGYAGTLTTNASTFCTSAMPVVTVTASTQGTAAAGQWVTYHATTMSAFNTASKTIADTSACPQGPWKWRGDGTGSWSDGSAATDSTGDNYSSGTILTDCMSASVEVGP